MGTDFFTVEVLTLKGLVTYYVLFFIQLESRRVCLAGITPHPDQQWMEQMGRNVTMKNWGFLANSRFLLHDRDTKFCMSIGHQDNNVAEYVALLEALQHAIAVNAGRLRVYSDSEIVVKQMTGEYACRSPRLHSLNWTCRKLARLVDFSIEHIPREYNQEANELAHHATRVRAATTVSQSGSPGTR